MSEGDAAADRSLRITRLLFGLTTLFFWTSEYCHAPFFTPYLRTLNLTAKVIAGLANGVLSSVPMALCIRYVAPEKKSTAMGTFQAIYSIGMTVGPILMGYCVDGMGYGGAFSIFAGIALLGGLIALLTVPKVRSRMEAAKQA